jgi:hypothetical protein
MVRFHLPVFFSSMVLCPRETGFNPTNPKLG